jgi:hypothetical protein
LAVPALKKALSFFLFFLLKNKQGEARKEETENFKSIF